MTTPRTQSIEWDHGVTTIDTGFQRPGMAASHLVVDHGRAAFIDVGTSRNAAHLLAELDRRHIPRDAVDYVMVTHVHLDHAGGAGVLLRGLPRARLVVHPRGARHMVDPARLIAGATAIYGDAEMARSYGEIAPVPQERVLLAPEGLALELGSRTLRFIETPGHALHHYCVIDQTARGVFTGDSFGLSYRDFDTSNGPWILPTTTPIQFDPDALHATVTRIADLGLPYVYLTHFGRVGDVPRLAADMHRMIDQVVAIARSVQHAEDRHERLNEALSACYVDALRAHGCTLPAPHIRDLLWIDIELNAQGLEHWMDHNGTR